MTRTQRSQERVHGTHADAGDAGERKQRAHDTRPSSASSHACHHQGRARLRMLRITHHRRYAVIALHVLNISIAGMLLMGKCLGSGTQSGS
jgi:hypothetical protein